MSEATWEHVRFGDPEAWVAPEPYEASAAAKEGAHTTFLLWSRQVHAETGASFSASALRLETALAVQNESQWKLNFNPQYQDVTLHWLRVVRGGEKIDHRRKDRMRLLQRETKLEHHVIDGSWTLVAVLDDVRPGDIIEAAYTLVSRHPITLGRCEVFFYVPSHLVVSRFRLQLLFASGRPALQWKASADAPAREESSEAELTRWSWSGSRPAAAVRAPEPQCPSSFLDYTWVQISDWRDWGGLAERVARTWQETLGEAPPVLADFPRPERVDRGAVAGVVRRIQDDYRYLSVDLTVGGWIPANPSLTASRRYGDCKDLVWFAVTILRAWGVRARPILVGSRLRETVRTLLPMSILFDHAVMEVEVEGQARWFDLTMRSQGGSYETQPVFRYEAGLPVDPEARELRSQPGGLAPSVHAVDETFYLDARPGFATPVQQAHRLEGLQAENTRRLRLAQGADSFADNQLKLAQRRYGKVKRVGELLWRDDREANVVEWIDAFEVQDIVGSGANTRASFVFPRTVVWETLVLPDDKPRRTPWALPYGAEYRHRVRAFHSAFPAQRTQSVRWETPQLVITVDQALEKHVWSKTSRLIVKAPFVPADQVAEHRRIVADFARRSSFQIGFQRARKPLRPDGAWGKLPAAPSTLEAYVPVGRPEDSPLATIGADWKGPSPVHRLRAGMGKRFWVGMSIFFVLGLISAIGSCQHT